LLLLLRNKSKAQEDKCNYSWGNKKNSESGGTARERSMRKVIEEIKADYDKESKDKEKNIKQEKLF